jgi:hypothetical protein
LMFSPCRSGCRFFPAIRRAPDADCDEREVGCEKAGNDLALWIVQETEFAIPLHYLNDP